jgi:DNA invertase Pin-like site-specific DNA recombinase
MRVIYSRVSTDTQNSDRQLKEGVKCYSDVCSGSVCFSERKHAKRLIKDIDKGLITEVAVSSIDRLGRNLVDIINTLHYFERTGVQLISQKEGLTLLNEKGVISPVSKLMIGLLGSIAEFERDRIRERQAEGIAIAIGKGKFLGRSVGSTYSTDKILNLYPKVVKYLGEKESLKRTALLAGVSVPTVIKVKKILANEKG